MKAKVDRELCVGLGNCVAVAPEAFKLDDQNKAIVYAESIDDDTLMKAAKSCPYSAISVEDDTGEQLYP